MTDESTLTRLNGTTKLREKENDRTNDMDSCTHSHAVSFFNLSSYSLMGKQPCYLKVLHTFFLYVHL